MRRQRFQKGSVHLRKHGRQRVWIAQWWDKGGKRSKVLGNYPSVVKGQAEAMLSQILAPINCTAGHSQAPIYTFQQYVQSVFLPAMRNKWKESTRSTSEPDIIRYLVPAFGQQSVHTISREQMQKFLEEKAGQLSNSVVGHLRWHLNAIYNLAQSDGLVEFNPAGALFTPACKPTPERRVLGSGEVRMALRLLDIRERLIFRMAVFDGMRPGEIFAIQLGRLSDTSVRIDRRIYEGNIDSPKGRKGKNTARIVALSLGSLADLEIWKRLLQDQAADAYLFPSETGRTPLRPNNLWKRAFRPRLELVGLEWINFQVLRRTNASLSRKAHVDDKVSADQRGHGLGVSLGVYAISDLDQKIEAVKKLESDVFESAQDADLRG